MRFSNFTKKGLALVLSLSMVVGVTATAPKTADAAKKSAKVPVSLMYCGDNGNWVKNAKVSFTDGNGSKKTSDVAAVNNGVTFAAGKKVHVKLTAKNSTSKNIKKAQCLVVDTYGILKTFKKVTYSNVKVTSNGKAVKAKFQQGYFEARTKTQSQRLVFFNEWGDDSTKEKHYTAKYPCKKGKSIVVEFDIVAK
ncbi:MAG: hypothetical protein KH026_12410 [Clostridium sp.]|nr:hypothetical protein [Clostridium sp.]